MHDFIRRALPALALALGAAAAQAHVTLPPGGGVAGSVYDAAFRVGHACKGASATTGVTVRLPEGFTFIDAEARPGWTVARGERDVTWTADSAQSALPDGERTRFTVRGRLPAQPGLLWFKVLQRCDRGSTDWAELPAADGGKPAYPAVRLEVRPAGQAAPAAPAGHEGHGH